MWTLTEREVEAFRAYLLKGGFAVFDDFKLPGEFGSGGGGWDTFEGGRARIAGWDVRSVADSDRSPVHMRPTGSYDGAVRGYRRRGQAAWGYGAHPLNVMASALVRVRQRPRVVGALAYLAGWTEACVRRAPRAEPARATAITDLLLNVIVPSLHKRSSDTQTIDLR